MTPTRSQQSASSWFITPGVRPQQQFSCDFCLWLPNTHLSSASVLTCRLLLLLRQTFLGKYRTQVHKCSSFPSQAEGPKVHDHGSPAFKVKDQKLRFCFRLEGLDTQVTPDLTCTSIWTELFLPKFENTRFLCNSVLQKIHIFF